LTIFHPPKSPSFPGRIGGLLRLGGYPHPSAEGLAEGLGSSARPNSSISFKLVGVLLWKDAHWNCLFSRPAGEATTPVSWAIA